MKTVISSNEGVRHIVEITNCRSPKNYKELKISTEWEGARRDESEQVQFRLILSPAQLANLKDLL